MNTDLETAHYQEIEELVKGLEHYAPIQLQRIVDEITKHKEEMILVRSLTFPGISAALYPEPHSISGLLVDIEVYDLKNEEFEIVLDVAKDGIHFKDVLTPEGESYQNPNYHRLVDITTAKREKIGQDPIAIKIWEKLFENMYHKIEQGKFESSIIPIDGLKERFRMYQYSLAKWGIFTRPDIITRGDRKSFSLRYRGTSLPTSLSSLLTE